MMEHGMFRPNYSTWSYFLDEFLFGGDGNEFENAQNS